MKYLLIPIVALLTGCAATDFLTNRVSCTVDGAKAMVNSMYGPVGISSKVDQADADVICKALKRS